MDLIHLTTPLFPEVVRGLAIGDMVDLTGTIVTGRDQVHKYLASGGKPPVDLSGLGIYHCGPVVVGKEGHWRISAAGPTTSMREEPYQAEVIERFRPGAILGKGGMGEKTRAALMAHDCVYLHVTGGAAQFLAERIVRVEAVYLQEFGQPEAMWVLSVRNLPALVTMDCRGSSLHERVREESLAGLNAAYGAPFTGGHPR